ncbi:MAG: spermidine/putrescine ABC transporter substrate-binding protein [Bacillota bacterium]|nr:spermidine/putrescine ABC transporter substrate-binding protein [Bacillota bacterium]
MKKFLAIFLTLVMVLLLLPGCSGKKKEVLKVFNWGEYIAGDVIADFEKEYNCEVIYETYDSNEAMMAKVQNSGSGNYDVVFPSDYTVSKMIELGLLHKIDYNNVPNAKYINESYKNLSYDPGNKYSLPYMAGTLGILYNTDKVTEKIDSIGALFDKKYAGQVLMLNGMRDTIGMTLLYLGHSMNTVNPKEIEEAKNLLISQKPNVLAYVGDEVKDKMENGEAALALVFSGEGNKAAAESKNLKYVIPKEGSNLAVDAMVILKDSQHIQLAESFLNYMYRTDIALRNANETGYTSPHTEAVSQLDASIKDNPCYYPPKEVLDKCEIFLYQKDEAEKLWSNAWTQILAS